MNTGLTFTVNGRKVNQKQFFKSMEDEVEKAVKDHALKQIEGMVDAENVEKPTVKMKGNSLNDMIVEVSGSSECIESLKNRLKG